MPRRPKSKEEKAARLRIAAYLRREYERYITAHPEGSQRAFADLLQVHEGTVSKIIAGRVEEAGLDVALGLNKHRGINGQDLLTTDPEPRYFLFEKKDGRARRHARRRALG